MKKKKQETTVFFVYLKRDVEIMTKIAPVVSFTNVEEMQKQKIKCISWIKNIFDSKQVCLSEFT